MKVGSSMSFPCLDFATLADRMSTKFKRNLRRQARKLSLFGTVSVDWIDDPHCLDGAFREFLETEASGWKGPNAYGSAISLNPRCIGFYRYLLHHFSGAGHVLIGTLRLGEQVIAAQYCLLSHGTLSVLKIAYDEAYRTAAPGHHLLYATLQYCCETPEIERLSLVTGPAWAPGRWKPDSKDVWDVHVFNESPRGIAAHTGACIRSALVSAISAPK
jgi:CelD/BcsL family acetyltransferase involved in cellulose biosynthesis